MSLQRCLKSSCQAACLHGSVPAARQVLHSLVKLVQQCCLLTTLAVKHTSDMCPCLQVLTKALQLHPAASGLWSYAAAWEFEHNSNAAAARTLMQRGLRMCKTSHQLWLEYFRMELMYAHKLRTRRRILGLDALPGMHAVKYFVTWDPLLLPKRTTFCTFKAT